MTDLLSAPAPVDLAVENERLRARVACLQAAYLELAERSVNDRRRLLERLGETSPKEQTRMLLADMLRAAGVTVTDHAEAGP